MVLIVCAFISCIVTIELRCIGITIVESLFCGICKLPIGWMDNVKHKGGGSLLINLGKPHLDKRTVLTAKHSAEWSGRAHCYSAVCGKSRSHSLVYCPLARSSVRSLAIPWDYSIMTLTKMHAQSQTPFLLLPDR